jgi:activator of 2-hydroxyglutaryl-CoA dehydratase
MIITCGIDVGSSSVKVAVIASPEGSGRKREGAELLSLRTWSGSGGATSVRSFEKAFEEALAQAKLKEEALSYVATTGEGELVDFRVGHFYGMTAHARGALFLRARGARGPRRGGAARARHRLRRTPGCSPTG